MTHVFEEEDTSNYVLTKNKKMHKILKELARDPEKTSGFRFSDSETLNLSKYYDLSCVLSSNNAVETTFNLPFNKSKSL